MKKITKPIKAYENPEFLNSSDARIIRMLAEFIEPQSKFRKHKIHLILLPMFFSFPYEFHLLTLFPSIFRTPAFREKAKISRIDLQKEEVVVELLESAVPIPLTLKMDSVKVIRRESEEEESKEE